MGELRTRSARHQARATFTGMQAAAAIAYATSEGAHIINGSYGSLYYSQAEFDALRNCGVEIASGQGTNPRVDVVQLLAQCHDLGSPVLQFQIASTA